MPIVPFHCERCGKEDEILVPRRVQEPIRCPWCGGPIRLGTEGAREMEEVEGCGDLCDRSFRGTLCRTCRKAGFPETENPWKEDH